VGPAPGRGRLVSAALRLEGPAPEQQLARDLARRAVPVAPVLVLVGALGWGAGGALSAGYGVLLVVVNFLLAAALITWAGRISLGFLMGAVLGGYLLRLGLLAAAVLLVRDAGWVEPVPLGLTVVVTHLGLLVWETRYVSASLAFPVLKPRKGALR
jgi:hypothetical protein